MAIEPVSTGINNKPRRPSWWLSLVVAVPAMVFLPIFMFSLLNIGFGPTVRTLYFFSMLAAIACGPVALFGFLIAVVRRRVSWLSAIFVLIAAAGSYAAFGRSSLWF